MLRAAGALVSCLALAGPAAGPSPDRDAARLQPGLFLYAAPGVADPRFTETVVLLVRHGPDGSMGLVVNRPTDMPLQEALDKVEEARGSTLPVYWGGPVQPEAILALVRAPSASPGAQTVLPDVHLTGDLADVRAALAGPDAMARLRVYTGYSGWGAGQLAVEVRAGVWVLDKADAASVFAPDPSKLWIRVQDLLKRLEVRLEGGQGLNRASRTQAQLQVRAKHAGDRIELRMAHRTLVVPLVVEHCQDAWAWTVPVVVELPAGSHLVTGRSKGSAPVDVEALRIEEVCAEERAGGGSR